MFDGDPAVSRRIYELSREVVDFQRAATPLGPMLVALEAGFDKYGMDQELRRASCVTSPTTSPSVDERVDGLRLLLRDILAGQLDPRRTEAERGDDGSSAAASNAQNDEVKKISAWAAILFAPTTDRPRSTA